MKASFFEHLGGGWYAVTQKCRESAELGFTETDPLVPQPDRARGERSA